MNALQIADELDGRLDHVAANMLRKQQAELEAFHNLVKEQDKKIIDLAFEKVYAERSAEVVAELYTHPVELTDEEIADMVCSGEYWELSEGQVIIAVHFDKFARAILRKASEK